MSLCKRSLFKLVALTLMVVFGTTPASAFNLKQMMEGISKPQESQKGSKSGGSPGGLFGGKPGGAPGGLFSGASKGGGPDMQGTSGSGRDYSDGGIVDLLCAKTKDPKELYASSSGGELKMFSKKVADDFGKSIENTQKILQDKLGAGGSIGWAETLNTYERGFDGQKIRKLFSNFIIKSQNRIELAGKIKYAMSDGDLEEEEIADAKFAYALILAHFNKHHKRQGYGERLLKSAYDAEAIGALYVWGRRIYRGEGVPKNVNKAQNFIFNAFDKIDSADQDKDPSEIDDGADNWEEPEKLWYTFAIDKEFEGHQKFKNLHAKGAEIRASLEKEIKKNSGSAARKSVERLVRIREAARKQLDKAFNQADKIAEQTEEFKDLQNQSDKSQQILDKEVAVSNAAAEFTAKGIKESNAELDPDGKKAVKDAHGRVRYVVAQMGKTVSAWFSTAGAGGLSDMVAMASELNKSNQATCKLNNALVDYSARKEIALDTKAPIKEVKGEDDFSS